MDDRDRVPRGRQSIGDGALDDDTEGHAIRRGIDQEPGPEGLTRAGRSAADDDEDDTEGHLRGGLPGSSRGGE